MLKAVIEKGQMELPQGQRMKGTSRRAMPQSQGRQTQRRASGCGTASLIGLLIGPHPQKTKI
jgi:hypothetical protein